jgi:hypothetical protein
MMIRERQMNHAAGHSQCLKRTDECRSMRPDIAVSTGVRAARRHHHPAFAGAGRMHA